MGFVDDDPQAAQPRMQGVPVLGSLRESTASLAQSRPDLVLVTIPSAPRTRSTG